MMKYQEVLNTEIINVLENVNMSLRLNFIIILPYI